MDESKEEMFNEYNSLNERITKLENFIENENQFVLFQDEKNDLREQLACMCNYRTVLRRRMVRYGLFDF